MAKTKALKDCLCKEIDCKSCPFDWRIKKDGINYNHVKFQICVTAPQEKTIGQIFKKNRKRFEINERYAIEKDLENQVELQLRKIKEQENESSKFNW